jgi:hypothetical protein
MAGILIAVFLGWAGGYRFYKKQTKLGIIYLLTAGLFGIGWMVDIYLAIREMMKLGSSSSAISSTEQVMGAFAECKKDPSRKRVEIIQRLNVGDPLNLEIGFYEGAPFYMVVDPHTGMDIGALPSETSKTIRAQFQDAKLSATLTKRDIDYPEIALRIER